MEKRTQANGSGMAPSGAIGADSSGGASVPGASREVAGEVAGAARQAASDLAGTARRAATQQIEGIQSQLASRVSGVADALRQTGEQLRGEESPASELVDQAVDRLDRAAEYLETRSLPNLMSDLGDFARREPALVFGGAFLAGIALGRFLKSSSGALNGRSPSRGGFSGPWTNFDSGTNESSSGANFSSGGGGFAPTSRASGSDSFRGESGGGVDYSADVDIEEVAWEEPLAPSSRAGAPISSSPSSGSSVSGPSRTSTPIGSEPSSFANNENEETNQDTSTGSENIAGPTFNGRGGKGGSNLPGAV